MPSTDKTLPENAKDNLDRKLDHAIEETFPTSDPVSVSVTKGGAIDYGREDATGPTRRRPSRQGDRTPAESFVGQARQAAGNLADDASEAAREAYDRGRRFVGAARERYPEVERYYREGSEAVRHRAAENPLLTLLAGIGIGYAIAWLLHSGGSRERESVPDFARTRRGYAPHRPQPRG
jgi:hypothetical protein